MKEEIKEILDNTLEYLEGIDETRNTKILTTNETNILLDYITNLQQTLDETVDYYTEEYNLRKHLDFKLNILQEENDRLKEENKRIFSKVNDDELLISNAMNYAEAQDYKQRNEKAIKYINEEQQKIDEMGDNYCYLDEYEINDLLKILQGEDKDEYKI